MNINLTALLADPCAGLTTAALTYALGRLAITDRERPKKFGAALGGAAFLGVLWHGVHAAKRPGALDLAAQALTLGLATLGVSWIVLALLAFLYETLVVAPSRALRERAERKRREDRDRREEERRLRDEEERRAEAAARAERLRSLPPPPPPEPPPTREELIRRAKAEFERDLELAALDPNPFMQKAGKAEAERRYRAALQRIGGQS